MIKYTLVRKKANEVYGRDDYRTYDCPTCRKKVSFDFLAYVLVNERRPDMRTGLTIWCCSEECANFYAIWEVTSCLAK